MAEAFLKFIGRNNVYVKSAGLEAGNLNPIAVQVMKESGIDISQNKTKTVSEILEKEKNFDYVITVCDSENSQKCPFIPGVLKKINWEFEDPSSLQGNYTEQLEKTRNIRDKIRKKVAEFYNQKILE